MHRRAIALPGFRAGDGVCVLCGVARPVDRTMRRHAGLHRRRHRVAPGVSTMERACRHQPSVYDASGPAGRDDRPGMDQRRVRAAWRRILRAVNRAMYILRALRRFILIAVIVMAVAPSGRAAGEGWMPAGDLHTARIYHTATRLLDGRVLVAGGRAGCCSYALPSAELFDPATSTWTDAASMPEGLVGTSALLNDGRVMIMGVPDNDRGLVVELYDPATNSWALARGPGYRPGSTMTVLA